MKTTIHKLITFLIILFFALPIYAVSVETGTYERDDQQRPGIRVYLDVNTDDVRDAFIDYLKDQYDFKLKGNGLFADKDELSAEKVLVEEIINKRINWFTEIIEADRSDSKTRMTIFVNLGYDVYLSEEQYEQSFDKVYQAVTDFVRTYVPSYHEERITETQEVIADLEDDTKDLRKDIQKNQEDIADLKTEIEEMETTISEKEGKLEQKKRNLARERESLRKVKQELAKINR